MSQHPGPEAEIAQLRDDLELSRRELADARVRLEAALEEATDERLRRERAEAEVAALTAGPDADARPDALGRLAARLRRQPT